MLFKRSMTGTMAVSAALAVVMVVPVLAAATSADAIAPVKTAKGIILPQDKKGNIVLHVRNEDAGAAIDVTIWLDGKKAVSTTFAVQAGRMIAVSPSPNSMISYTFRLAPGKHKLVAVSRKGQARLEKEFEVKNKHSIAVTYWKAGAEVGNDGKLRKTPNRFTFRKQDGPMLSM